MNLENFISKSDLKKRIALWLDEDFAERGDISSELLIDELALCSAEFRFREAGILCGLQALDVLIEEFAGITNFEHKKQDGEAILIAEVVGTIEGNYRDVLMFERTALNLLSRLSGIATMTANYRRVLKDATCEDVAICATRKTTPGLRGLEKFAVVCGGGEPHRMGLYDAVMWKDNHLAALETRDLKSGLHAAIAKARKLQPAPEAITIEVDTLLQLEQVLECETDVILLDNMSPSKMKTAVGMRNKTAPRIKLEASGGINAETLVAVAQSGVDRISLGALTHSAMPLDIGLDIVTEEV